MVPFSVSFGCNIIFRTGLTAHLSEVRSIAEAKLEDQWAVSNTVDVQTIYKGTTVSLMSLVPGSCAVQKAKTFVYTHYNSKNKFGLWLTTVGCPKATAAK